MAKTTVTRKKLITPPSCTLNRPILATFNTGTLYDLLVGDVVKGYDGKFYLRGGLGNFISGLYGVGNAYKSTICDGLVARSAAIYGGEVAVVDTEGSKSIERVIDCADDLKHLIAPENMTYISGAQVTIEELLVHITDICKVKGADMKSYTIETPFVNPVTGKREIAWVPTYVYIDSFSELFSNVEEDLLEKEGLGGKKMKTVFMRDGGQKTIFVRQIRRLCELYGIILHATSQVGNVVDMDGGMAPPRKKMQHMRQGEVLKSVGSKFYYLTRNLIEAVKANVLTNSAKTESEYCYGPTPIDDVNEILLSVVRCKTNLSGQEVSIVVSQSHGWLQAVSHYNYLKNSEKGQTVPGCPGSHASRACVFTPEIKFTRNSLREKANESYELRRALEICAQLKHIQNNWMPVPGLEHGWRMSPEYMYEKLEKKGSPKISDILNSVGYWTPTGSTDRESLSIFDIIALINK